MEIYNFTHKINYPMAKLFKTHLNINESIELENIQLGSHSDGYEVTVFNISEAKATSLQEYQNELLGIKSRFLSDDDRNLLIDKITAHDIQTTLKNEDGLFLYDVLVGNGFTQYNNLSDVELFTEIAEQLEITQEHRDLFTLFHSDDTYEFAFGFMAGVAFQSTKEFIENYDSTFAYVVYDKGGQIVRPQTQKKKN